MILHIPFHDSNRVAVTHRLSALALATLSLAMLIVAPITSLHAQAKGAAKGLAAPENLWAAQTSPTEVTLVWDTVPGATAYRIYAPGAVSLGTVGRILQPLRPVVRFVLDIRRFIVTSLDLQLEAVDAKGQVSQKVAFNQVVPVAKAATSARVPPPTNVIATETAPGVITLAWDPVPGATAYALGRAVWPNGLSSLCALCPTHTTYVDSGVTQAVQHSYSVLAITPNGNSAYARSNVVTPGGGTTAPGPGATLPPKGATNPKAVLIAPDSVKLTWTSDPKATGYVIERSMNGASFQVIASVAGQIVQFVDVIQRSALAGSALYRIVASNAKGPSPAVAFNPITLLGPVATLPPKGATNPKAVLISPDSVKLTWTADPKATGYVIERSMNGMAFQVIASVAGQIVQFVDVLQRSALAGSALYRIVASNAKGRSPAVAFNAINWPGPKANAPPAGVTGAASAVTSPSSITLSWVPDPAATSYRIERSLSGRPFRLLATLPGAVPSYVDAVSGLIKQNPKYRIFSVNAAGMSSAVVVP